MKGVVAPEVPKGTVFGCWTVLRPAPNEGRGARYTCRATCCGRTK